ncbi:MAG: glycosyltransferase [Candidatus Puniceispirillaceae bacterium]
MRDFTIIIPTVSLDKLTEKCAHLCKQYAPDAEIIIVADKEPPADHPLQPVTIVRPNLTIAAKRNLAAQLSTRTLLAFIDSDAYPDRQWLENALAVFNTYPDYVAAAGPNIAPPDEPLGQQLVGLVEKSNIITINAHYIKKPSGQRDVDVMPSCNFLIKKEAFIKIGMMDEALSGGEDFELCSRLKKENWPIRYEGNIVVFHKSRNLKSFLKKRLSYGGFAYDNILKSVSLPILITIIPAFFVLFLSSFPVAFISDIYSYFYSGVLALFLCICALEALRLSTRISLFLPLYLLLIIGITAPGFGTLARLFHLLPSYKTLYRNYE